MNINTLNKLHYEELKEIVKSYCVSGLGKKLIDKLTPSNNIKVVNRLLDETSEGRNLLDAGYHMPLDGIFNINPLIEKLEKGGTLEPSELTTISNFLRGCKKVKRFIKDKEGYAKTLALYGEGINELSHIEEEIEKSINGSMVDSNASKNLRKIRKQIDICQGTIKERLDKFIKNPTNREYIQEFFISNRGGKYTIPIKASFKNQVSGIVVETSPSRSTVFMEPSTISKYALELNNLKLEESVEEYKILGEISEIIFSSIKELKINIEIIAEYDMIFAKAKYSKEIGGIKPSLNSRGIIKIIKGKYPLLKDAIPLDFSIGEDYRSLIITGPNAGGKTVVLKTVGLLTLQVMSGFHIAAEKETEIAIFENIFVEIGDNQSIENALSTFSSHVKNLASILRESSKNTLLLFDEIGSGTEPNEGAALAIALLEEFYQRGCITVATTHYGEIKNFSEKHPDFENAAMEFKVETLEPLYKLHIGKSGDSNALYISEKMGINKKVIEKARGYIENKDYDYSLVKESKKSKEVIKEEKKELQNYEKGDKVFLIEENISAIVYSPLDEFNNLVVFVKGQFKEVNYKRIKLEIKAKDLYPEGYDLEQIFVDFKERKLKRDIERGSKKALKKISKEHFK